MMTADEKLDFLMVAVSQVMGQLSTINSRLDDHDRRLARLEKIREAADFLPQGEATVQNADGEVLIPIANGSEEMEIIVLVDVLRRANIKVVLASVEKSTNIVGSQRTRIVADKCISDVSESKYDLIILPSPRLTSPPSSAAAASMAGEPPPASPVFTFTTPAASSSLLLGAPPPPSSLPPGAPSPCGLDAAACGRAPSATAGSSTAMAGSAAPTPDFDAGATRSVAGGLPPG
ncbi:hypothetical protein GUJ93_ZPchr0008g11938 [Zizania palustris]|uniref:DJ-1/PfpI domain-containing protein n=1 Tax=Zizania palustris TaxID=103762 RepID=A0A8J5RX84_ZIZPA|nr:hypothetical protein GUJ93_ZPchr0008g11938 [Zizania palustris]